MFGWFSAKCPVDPVTKAWIEERLAWLEFQFGLEPFIEAPTILPTLDFFPDPYDGSDESVRAMLDRVCKFMRVDPWRVQMELVWGRDGLGLVNDAGKPVPSDSEFAGLYSEAEGRFIVQLDSRQINEPMNLVGTIAHELSHARLRGEGRVDEGAYDEELLTDLNTVYHGFGVFLANSPRNWDGMYTNWPETSLRKPEYMTLPMYGYVLAHCAWLRNEQRPDWVRHLRPDARAVFKEGLRYLVETGDSEFRPERLR